MPKIAYVGMFGKLWDEEGIARGLEANGATVHRFSEQGFSWGEFREKSVAEKYDYFLFAKLKIGAPARAHVVEFAKQQGIYSVCLVPDLYWGLSREYRIKSDPIFKADLVLTPDGGERDWPCNHKVFRQAIPDEFCYIEEPEKPQDNVVFVGSLNGEYPYRTELIQNLEKRYGDKFVWFGKANPDDIRGHKLNQMIANTGVQIGESVYAPYYWSNRIYETLGRGGFMVHPKIEGLDKEYEPYKHFVPYSHGDYKGLYEIIDYYLAHPDERRKIGEAAHKHTKLYHTQSVRCGQLLNVLRAAHDN